MSLADLVRDARKKKGLSQAALAEMIGLTQQAIGQIETGATLRPENWRELARVLDIRDDEMAEVMREGQREARIARGGATVRFAGGAASLLRTAGNVPAPRPARKIPVVGRVAGSPFGEGHLIMGQMVDQTDCPPWLEDVQDAYALYVVGTSMVPRFYPGEMVFVHPWKQPRPDDFVVAQIRDKTTDDIFGYVKQFIGFDKRGLRLRQFSPKVEELPPIAEGDVYKLHKVVIPGLG